MTSSELMKRNLQIIGGVVAVLVGLGFIMPAVAQLRTEGALPGMSVALLLGVFLSLGGGWGVLAGARQTKTLASVCPNGAASLSPRLRAALPWETSHQQPSALKGQRQSNPPRSGAPSGHTCIGPSRPRVGSPCFANPGLNDGTPLGCRRVGVVGRGC